MKLSIFLLALILVCVPSALPACEYFERLSEPPPWAYDRGPDPETPEGRALIDHLANLPFMPGVSQELTGGQKFRPDFGSVAYRISNGPIKMLIKGQDATHIAEAAGRTATAGFGGRAQDLANYFGVDESSAYWNAYQYTIRGQYGAFDSPYIFFKNGKPEVRYSGLVDNNLWTMTHEGAQAEWANKFTEMLIQQNPELKLMVLFGGASRDTSATFVKSLGGYVGSRFSARAMKDIQVPEMELKYAGGNNQFPVLIGKRGQDLYSEFLERKLDYSKVADQKAAKEALEENLDWFMERMVFTRGGPYKNGLLNPAQLGGYDIRNMRINGEKTLSLKGLVLSDGSVIENDILMVQLPHPSALSRLKKDEASKRVASALKGFKPYVEAGWKIEPDPGQTNQFHEGKPYLYGRSDIGPEYYDFGTPATRQVPVSTASRMKGKPYGIVFGTRDRVSFDPAEVEKARNSQPSEYLDPNQVWTSRVRTPGTRYIFDSGPGEHWARVMKENLPVEEIFQPKEGKSFEEDGISALNVKNHQDVGDFGHYRGSFENPKVLILADPQGVNDLMTARAMTGARGQYLHGLMEDVGVGDNYLVIKTVPFRMDGASKKEWDTVLDQTQQYRDALIGGLLQREQQPDLIIADGPRAQAELERILGKDPRIVNIRRGKDPSYGIKAAGKRIASREGFQGDITGDMRDIPRSHLSFYARYWEGRGGDQVISAKPGDKNEGLAFAMIAPEYATEQKVDLSDVTREFVDSQIQALDSQGLPLPGERMPTYLNRVEND